MKNVQDLNIIFKAVVGSHAYGTSTPESDKDIKGVYIQSPEDVLVNGYREQITVTDDEVYYELRRFVDLCCTANPTMLELLFMPKDCIIVHTPLWQKVLDRRDEFLSKSCRHSFGGYAWSQISKASGLDKKMNWEQSRVEKKSVLDFCHIHYKGKVYTVSETWANTKNIGLVKLDHMKDCYAAYYGSPGETWPRGICSEDSHEVHLSEVPKLTMEVQTPHLLYFNRDEYSKHCRDYASYQQWLQHRNTARYVDTQKHGQKIDGKNLLHCVRLLRMAKEIADGQGVIVRRPDADYLLSIRRGEHNLEDILAQCKQDVEGLSALYAQSKLPDHADRGELIKLVTTVRQEYYHSQSIGKARTLAREEWDHMVEDEEHIDAITNGTQAKAYIQGFTSGYITAKQGK